MSEPSVQPARRSLRFENFDEMLAEVHRLREHGYRAVGRWDLAQICDHLSLWLSYPLDGFPRQPLPVRLVFAVLRPVAGKRMLANLLKTGTMAGGMPTLKESVPRPGGDEAAAVARWQDLVARFRHHTGPLHASPMFGEMDRETAMRLQLIHAALHLGYLIPND